MARYTRKRYQKEVLVVEDALTTSRDLNVAGLSSAITLCADVIEQYTDHVADFGSGTEEHKALHTAGVLASVVTPSNLTTLLARVNDITAKYTLHNADAAAALPDFHQAQGTTRVLAATTTVTTLSGAITRLNDIKAKFNLHDADSTAHTTGSKYQVSAADSALGVAIKVTSGMEDVRIGDKVAWSILNDGTGNVTGVSAATVDGGVVFTFSADPQDDAIISYTVAAQ
jgi:hypothetical protein